MIAMFDPRVLYASGPRPAFLGDSTPNGIDPSSLAANHQDPSCLDAAHPLTNYCTGRLDGWVRTFTREGYFLSNQDLTLPADQRPTGPVPSVSDWAAFDSESARRGVAGYVNLLKKNSTPSTDFLSSFSRILSNLGGAIETFNVKRLLSSTQDGLNLVAAQIDKVLPGLGGIVLNTILGALNPLGPLISDLTGVVASAASNVGAHFVATAVAGAGSSGTAFFSPGLATSAASPVLDGATQAQIGDSIVASLSSLATSGATDLAPLKGTLLRLSAAYRTTNGSLATKLEAVAAEALKEYVAAATLTCTIASLGTASVACDAAATAIIAGAQALLAVDNALLQASSVKTQAALAKKAAIKEAAHLDQEAADLERQIAALERSNAAQASSDQSSLRVLAALAAAVLVGRALA